MTQNRPWRVWWDFHWEDNEIKWEYDYDSEFWLVSMTKECDRDNELIREIIDYYTNRGIWAISNMVYFYKESDLTFFQLRWG